MCLIMHYSFEEEICFHKRYFSEDWSEYGEFFEAILKQTETTKLGLSLVFLL